MTVSSALKTLLIGASFSAALINPAAAQENGTSAWALSGNAAFKSDYVFRGFSQTDEEPSVQGTIALNHDSGFAASLWGSNINFSERCYCSALTKIMLLDKAKGTSAQRHLSETQGALSLLAYQIPRGLF